MKFTRRSFLKMGCAAAGGLLLPSMAGCDEYFLDISLPFTGKVLGEDASLGHLIRDRLLYIQAQPPEKHLYDVIIVGAGPSGLTSAIKFQKSGLENFLIIDKEQCLGGMCRCTVQPGLKHAVGSHFVDFPEPAVKHMIEMYSDCGVITGTDDDGYPVVAEEHHLKMTRKKNMWANGTWIAQAFPEQIADKADKEAHKRFDRDVLRWSDWRDPDGRPALGLPFSRLSRSPEVLALDGISFAQYLRDKGMDTKVLRWFLTNRLQDEYGTPIERLSAWAGLQYFRKVDIPPSSPSRSTGMTWPEGLSFLGHRMEQLIPEKKKRRGLLAVKIRNLPDRVETTFYDPRKDQFGTLHSRHLVLAVPKPQVHYILPELAGKGRDEFRGHSYVSWLVAVIHMKRPPLFRGGGVCWDNLIHGSWTLGWINNQHQVLPFWPDEALVGSLYAAFPYNTREERRELLDYGWDYWARLILLELRRVHPDIDDVIERMDIWKWGHPMRQTVVGSCFGEQRLKMKSPLGRVHFSHVDTQAVPVYEEAVYRGYEVAQEVLAQLGLPFVSSI